jgi:hypothetical protein
MNKETGMTISTNLYRHGGHSFVCEMGFEPHANTSNWHDSLAAVGKVMFMLACTLFSTQAFAQVHQARGQFSIFYKDQVGTFGKKEAPAKVKQQAQLEAGIKAIEAYFAEAGQAEAANFDRIRSRILEEPSRYILESTIIAEEDNTKDFKYTVVVRASLNVANLRNLMQANSAVGKAASANKSMLSFVFVSRQVAIEKTFDDRVSKRAEVTEHVSSKVRAKEGSTTKEASSEGESVEMNRVDTHGSKSQSKEEAATFSLSGQTVVALETSGSTTRKASEVTWKLLPSANLNQVFTSQFSQAGFEVVEASMVESVNLSDIEADYQTGNDLKPETIRAVAKAMKAAEVPYVVLGTLDVGLPIKDPQTGLMRVDVIVNAKVWDVTKPIPRTRAAVGPISYAGMGPTEEVARVNALRLAASNAAQELTSRLNNQSIY